MDIVFEGRTVGNSDGGNVRAYAFFIYENPGLRVWFEELVEARAYRDRAYGLPDETLFFPANVIENLQILDELGGELPERGYYPR